MRVKILLFASLAETAGTGSEVLEMEPGASVRQAWEMLAGLRPALGKIGFRPLVTCDMEYTSWDTELVEGVEVAFLPPVSGG